MKMKEFTHRGIVIVSICELVYDFKKSGKQMTPMFNRSFSFYARAPFITYILVSLSSAESAIFS